MKINKPKLNEPDVETTFTTFNSATGESITINQTIPSRQFKDIFVTGTTVEECVPTKEEIKKEWEDLGYEWIEEIYADSIVLRKTVVEPWLKNDTHKVNHFITINVINKTYRAEKFEWFACKGKALTFQEHQLLTKTFKWLEWEV